MGLKMPAIGNITIKAANGTTDVVYTALAGSAGDSIPARWRVESAALPIGQRINLSAITKPNGKGDARQVQLRHRYPVVRNVGGVDTLVGTIPLEITATYGEQYTQAEIDEAVAQALNLANHASVREVFKTTFAPT